MRKSIFISIIIVLPLLIFVGCANNKEKLQPPDKNLLEFLPSISESYLGDSGYFHIVKNIERESKGALEIAILKGEVKDNEAAVTKDDFNFEIILTVDANKIVQSYNGSRLNESNFDHLELLKRPLEVGNKWTFTTKDLYGSKWKVTGEITAINETGDEIVVKHSTKDGYYEERTLQKGRGVTDFLRLLVFKKESTFTGYHVEKESVSTTEKASSPVDSLKIPVAYYNLILGFDQAWSGYVKQENDDLLKFISEGSPAYEKIKAVPRDANTAIEFIRFYPYEMTEKGSILAIKVVEIFKTNDEEAFENKVLYQIVIEKGVAKIVDFETIQ